MTTRIGDNVHFVATRELETGAVLRACRAATVTEICNDDTRSLYVLDPVSGASFVSLVPYDSPLSGVQDRGGALKVPDAGTWHGMDECNPDGQTLSRLWSGDMSGIGPAFGPR